MQKSLHGGIRPRLAVVGGPSQPVRQEIRVPARHNPLLLRIVERVNADVELWTLWKCANVNSVERLGNSDHGWVHVQIVANLGLKLLRLLMDAGVQPGIVQHHGLGRDEAEVVVVLGALLHDLGICVHQEEHERHSLFLAQMKLRDLLADCCDVATRTVLFAEALHTVIAHRWDVQPFTREAGVVKVADALDMTKGRTRTAALPPLSGPIAMIEAVEVHRGQTRPAAVEVVVASSVGIQQLEDLLLRQFQTSGIQDYLELSVRVAPDVTPPVPRP